MDLDGHFMYLQFLNNHTNSCYLLTKLLADAFQPCAALQSFSLMFFHSSLVLPIMLERLEWKKSILKTGVLYTKNDIRPGLSVIDQSID